ncbi:MAG: xanthine dehydrogenase family protein molybdopterin-binding subunit, partial [Thermodesulfobacteriota bacterium]
MPELSMVGRSVVRLDSRDKVTGGAKFVTDLSLPRLLCGKILRSPYPHARLLKIDVTRALSVPGVRAILTAEDTPKNIIGHIVVDEVLIAFEKVRYVGQEVAALAAESEEAAEEALGLIEVEYEELPPVFDPEVALGPDAPLIHDGGNLAYHFEYQRGDIEQGFRESDHIFESRYTTQSNHQGYIEPRGCLALADPTGKVTIWAGVQSIFRTRSRVAKFLDLAETKVRVIQPYTGGGFGGKTAPNEPAVAALLALKTGRPVRLVNTQEEEFKATRPRVPAIIYQKLGVKKDGTLLARQVRVIADCGALSGNVPHIAETMAQRPDNLYHFAHLKGEGFVVYTNNTPGGACRGFGNPQGHFPLESELDEIARTLKLDPVELRMKNAVNVNEVTLHGWKIGSCGLKDCLKLAGEKTGWRDKRANKKPGQGIGLAVGIHVSGNRRGENFAGSAAFVKVDPSGNVALITGESDTGQGAWTALAQIVAEELGIEMNSITVAPADTDIAPFCLGAYASRVAVIGGQAVRVAALDARQQLFAQAAQVLEANPEDLEASKGRIYVRGAPDRGLTFVEACRRAVYRQGGGPILGRGTYDPPTVQADKSLYGNFCQSYPFCAQVVEVEVDQGTGQVRLVNIFAADDVGKVINPILEEGQVHGCLSQAVGFSLMEEIARDNGNVINP